MSNFSFKRIKRDFKRLCWDDLPEAEQTYDHFISLVYNCLDELIGHIEENCMLRVTDSEDRLTDELKVGLRQKNLFDTVEHDAQSGGHVDLVVRLDGYVWKCEAKIFGGRNKYKNKWLYKGFNALTQKYSRASQYDCSGAVLIYVKAPNTKRVMLRWQTYLKKVLGQPITYKACTANNLAFFSDHIHVISGMPYSVRHIPISIYDATKTIEEH